MTSHHNILEVRRAPSPSAPDVHGVALPLTIGPVRLGEVWGASRLQRRAFGPALGYGFSTLLLLRLLPQVRFLVAREGARIVGCAIGDREGGSSRVVNLCVDPDFRRRGMGTRLLRALEATLPDGDIVLMVQEENSGARALYQREGYTQVGRAEHYYGRGRHGIWMQKQRSAASSPKVWL